MSLLSFSYLLLSFVFVSFLSFVSCGESLQVLHPPALSSQFFYGGIRGGIQVKPALFGIPPFLKVLEGVLVYAPQTANGCTLTASDTVNVMLNHYTNAQSDESTSIILLVERGGCSFVDKVLRAQTFSDRIKSVIIYDDEIRSYLTVMGGENKNVIIPSLFTSRTDAVQLIQIISASSTTSSVTLRLSYSVPNPDGRVEMDFWSISMDKNSDYFRTSFGSAARRLAERLLFTPHYFTQDGVLWGCYGNSGVMCGNQCTNNGRYCLPDPELNLNSGYSGMDLVRENVRQICLWKFLNQVGKTNLMFDYWEKLALTCNSPDQWATHICSYGIIDSLGLAGFSSSSVARCIDDAGGLDFLSNNRNTILDEEMAKQSEYLVRGYPTVLVNNQPYYGSLYCPLPIEQATCGVLQMSCQGYAAGTRPVACDSSISCPFGQNRDACGACGEGAVNRPCSSSSDFPVYGIILIVLALCVSVAGGVYFYMRRQQNRMKNDIDMLLRQYLPLDAPMENQVHEIRANVLKRHEARSDETELSGML
jgi:hypothetical protein